MNEATLTKFILSFLVDKPDYVELDLEQQIWTIPETRMKAKKEHKVPLSPQALNILEQQII